MAAYDFPDTAGKPTDGSFEYTAPDGTLYEWNGYAWVVPVDESGGGSGGGAARVLTQVLPPSPAEDGDMYWCTDDGRLYLYYDDADTKQWVDASPDGGGSGSSAATYWDRNGTTLSPSTAGDDVETAGNVKTSYLNVTANPIQTTGDLVKINGVSEGSTTIGYDGSATFGKSSSDSNATRGIRIIQGTFSPLLSIDSASGGGANVVFQTNLDGAPTYRLNGNGTIVTRGIQIETDTDNPANYVSTMVDGEETQVYNGPTLDVKALLLTLQTAAARITTLEETNASLEARLTALEGGTN